MRGDTNVRFGRPATGNEPGAIQAPRPWPSLGLEGLAVERVVLTVLGMKIVRLVTSDPDATRCPVCRSMSTSGMD